MENNNIITDEEALKRGVYSSIKGPQRGGTDWVSQLKSDEFFLKKDGSKEFPVVLLRGLRRLANLAGLIESDCSIQTVIINNMPLVQCVYTTKYSDCTKWTGTGDCSHKSTDEPYVHYPTAVAESRAEARCHKKALGIEMVSAEEIGFKEDALEVSPNKPIDSSVIRAIETVCDAKKIDLLSAIEAVIKNEKRCNEIYTAEQLTIEEGQAILQYLNKLKVKKS